MIRVGYGLQSREKYTITPDDGVCDLCNKCGPVMHLVDKDYKVSLFGVSRTEVNLINICEKCTRQIADAFSWGNDE